MTSIEQKLDLLISNMNKIEKKLDCFNERINNLKDKIINQETELKNV